MMGNISIIIFSSLFILIGIFYISRKWPDLDIIDLYIIFVILHFGLYPFIRGFYFGQDVIFDFRQRSPLAIGLVFLHILAIMAIIRGISLYFPNQLNNNLKISYMIDKWSQINRYLILSIYFWLILFQLFSYYKYGVKNYIVGRDFAIIGKDLPYWFTSMRTIFNLVAFLVFLGLFANLVKSTGYQRYIWLVLTIIFVPAVTINGRRFFIAMVVCGVIFWWSYRRENIFQWKFIRSCLILLVALLLFSNFFQTYRYVFQNVGKIDWGKLKSPLSAALNFEITIKNLKSRPGTWEFNFLVIDHQIQQPGMVTQGKISWEGLKSSIPRAFWRDKKFILIDDILSNLYNVNPKEIDIGKNLFGVGQVDFSYFSIIIIPLIILSLVFIMASMTKAANDYPLFLWLISGNILFFLVNIEENGNEIFFMLRNLILLIILFYLYVISHKIYSSLLNYKMGKQSS